MTLHRLIVGSALSIVMASAVGGTLTPLSAGGDVAPATTLCSQVEAFFRAEDSKTRDGLGSAIAAAAQGDIRAVARCVENAALWTEPPGTRGAFTLPSQAYGAVEVAYSLPAAYDPGQRYPTVLCMPDAGISAEKTLAHAAALLGGHAAEFVLVCPNRRIGGSFHQPRASAGDLRRLVRALRKRIHTDTDRAYLLGIGMGAEVVWLGAIAHADLFAGAVVLSGYPRVPYPEQAYPMLLGNLRHVPVLTVWSSADDPRATSQQELVAAHNRGIVEFAQKASLPITGIELAFDAAHELPATALSAVLDRGRPKLMPAVSHWFRYPSQGQANWLRQAKYAGEVWEADQLSILASATTDRDSFVQDVFKANLAYLGGSIDGQTITIETRRCARAELLFGEGMIDFSTPVTIICNGRKRHGGLIRPSIKTLLDSAYDQWEFQRLVWARRSFSIRAN